LFHLLTVGFPGRACLIGKALSPMNVRKTTTIGQPEYPGRVRAAGADVTIKQYFGPTSRSTHMSMSMALEDLEQLIQKIRDQLEELITEKMIRQLMMFFS